MFEVIRTPQLRDVRQLQHRREALEEQIYRIQQREQRVLATTAMSSYGLSEHFKERGSPTAVGGDHWKGQVPGSKVGAITTMSTRSDQTWSQQQSELVQVPGLQAGSIYAVDSNLRDGSLEQCDGLYAPRLHQADDSDAHQQGEPGRARTRESWSQVQEPSPSVPWLSTGSSTRDHSHWQRDGRVNRDLGGHGCDHDQSSTRTDLRSVSWRDATTSPTSID